jgi:Ribbon-helix-helix protein, copG family
MPPARPRTSRVFTISFPEPLAQQVEQVARDESRNISELFREAFRLYKLQLIDKQLEAIRRTLPPTSYTPDDVESLVHEVRLERGKLKKV